MAYDRERFGNNLRAERSRRRWTQYDLANESGVPQPSIKCYELAENVPSVEAACKLADAFGMTVDDLVGT